jgi:hypothetical protein
MTMADTHYPMPVRDHRQRQIPPEAKQKEQAGKNEPRSVCNAKKDSVNL